jgi:hypothetical protein
VLKWQQSPLNSSVERALLVAELDKMVAKKSAEPSPESIARANRQRSAAEEAERAMADVEQRAIAVRKNMARLRALREAREAEGARTQVTVPSTTKKKRKGAFSR